jgi:hypothetical protein
LRRLTLASNSTRPGRSSSRRRSAVSRQERSRGRSLGRARRCLSPRNWRLRCGAGFSFRRLSRLRRPRGGRPQGIVAWASRLNQGRRRSARSHRSRSPITRSRSSGDPDRS